MRYCILVLLAACSLKDKPPPPRPDLIETVRDFADRCEACNNDKACVHGIRDEWDGVKRDVMQHGLTGEQKRQFDAERMRFGMCGDAAGLTIWN